MKPVVSLFLLFSSLISCRTSAPEPGNLVIISPAQPQARATAWDPSNDVDLVFPWNAAIDGTEYRWDGKELFIKRPNAKRVAVFARAAKEYMRSFQSENGRCSNSSYFRLLAVVGNMISYKHESGVSCGIQSGQWRYATVNVAHSTRFLDLRTFFSDEQLLGAFLANPQLSADIQKAVTGKKIDTVPSALSQLSSFLTKYDYQIYNGDSFFQPDYLTRFTFHHLEGDTVCVRVSASSTSTAGRANHQYAEIYLPIPESLRDHLQKADAGEQGFLMRDAPSKVGTSFATFDARF